LSVVKRSFPGLNSSVSFSWKAQVAVHERSSKGDRERRVQAKRKLRHETGTNEARVLAFERWLAEVGRTHRDRSAHDEPQGRLGIFD